MKADLGPQTHKGQLDQDEANKVMNYLKSSHFILGKDQNTFAYRWNSQVNKLASTQREAVPWAKQKHHIEFGIDCENRTSDYSMRF